MHLTEQSLPVFSMRAKAPLSANGKNDCPCSQVLDYVLSSWQVQAWKHPQHLLFIIHGCIENRHVPTEKEEGKEGKEMCVNGEIMDKGNCELLTGPAGST